MAIEKGRLQYRNGQRIAEDELNSLAQQTVGFFENAAARDAAYPNTAENPTPMPTFAFLWASGTLQYWDGMAWQNFGGGAPPPSSEELYSDSADYSYTGSTGGTGPNSRTVNLSRNLVAADAGRQIAIETKLSLGATERATMGAPAAVVTQLYTNVFFLSAAIIAGTEAWFAGTTNNTNANLGWGGARGWMPAANQLAIAIRTNESPYAVRQRVVLL